MDHQRFALWIDSLCLRALTDPNVKDYAPLLGLIDLEGFALRRDVLG